MKFKYLFKEFLVFWILALFASSCKKEVMCEFTLKGFDDKYIADDCLCPGGYYLSNDTCYLHITENIYSGYSLNCPCSYDSVVIQYSVSEDSLSAVIAIVEPESGSLLIIDVDHEVLDSKFTFESKHEFAHLSTANCDTKLYYTVCSGTGIVNMDTVRLDLNFSDSLYSSTYRYECQYMLTK